MSTSTKITLEEPTYRSPLVVAIRKRFGNTTKIMKDRRTPRAGTRNKQRDYQEERY